MESASFYILCPSNASFNLFNENTASEYKIALPKRIYLQGHYEVALVEIQYPVTWNTFNEDRAYRVKVQSTEDGSYGESQLTKTKYSSARELTHEITRALTRSTNNTKSFLDAITHDTLSNRVEYNFEKYKLQVRLSKSVLDTLGIANRGSWMQGKGAATYPPDISYGFNSLYIYCNVVQPQIVGDVYAPLLRTVAIPVVGRGHIIQKTYDQPHYVPVSTDELSTIEINIKDDTGTNVSFASGKVICKLHFRQKAL